MTTTGDPDITTSPSTPASAPPIPAVSPRERRTVLSLTAAFGLLLVVWALVTPLFGAPDEAPHLNSVVRVAEGGGWPAAATTPYYDAVLVMRESAGSPPAERPTVGELLTEHPGFRADIDQMSQHPPTYYAVAAGVLRLVDYHDVRWDHAVVLLRLLDVVLVAPLPLLAWATVRRVTRSPRAGVVGALAVFVVPQVAQIGSSLSNDAPVMLLGASIVYAGSRLLTGDLRWRTLVALGLLMGTAAATKGTALPLVPFVAVVALFSGVGVLAWPVRVLRLAVAGALTLAVSGWWWIHNVLVYGTLQPNGMGDARPEQPWPAGETVNVGAFANQIWSGVSASFWGNFGSLKFPMSPVLTDALTMLVVLPVLAFALRRRQDAIVAVALATAPVALFASLALTVFNTYAETQGIYGTQGRYLFPGLVAGIALAALAWRRMLVSEGRRRGFSRGMLVGAPLVALYGLTVAYRGFYQDSDLEVTRAGLALLSATAPTGRLVLVVVVLAFAAVGTAALWQARWITRTTSPLEGTEEQLPVPA
jgi:4-amino-4-deoxy-L-arabinose transferase-like glycosyltransferase